MNKNTERKHHYVSNFLLKNFLLEGERKFNVYNDEKNAVYPSGSNDTMALHDFNWVDCSSPIFLKNPLAYERMFAKLESFVAPKIIEIIEGSADLSDKEIFKVLEYFAMIMFRNPRSERLHSANLIIREEVGEDAFEEMCVTDFARRALEISNSDSGKAKIKRLSKEHRSEVIDIQMNEASEYLDHLLRRSWNAFHLNEGSHIFATDSPILYYPISSILTEGLVEWRHVGMRNSILIIPLAYNVALVSLPEMHHCIAEMPENINFLRARVLQVIQKECFIVSPYRITIKGGIPGIVSTGGDELEYLEARRIIYEHNYEVESKFSIIRSVEYSKIISSLYSGTCITTKGKLFSDK
jgi:hypothetical protein